RGVDYVSGLLPGRVARRILVRVCIGPQAGSALAGDSAYCAARRRVDDTPGDPRRILEAGRRHGSDMAHSGAFDHRARVAVFSFVDHRTFVAGMVCASVDWIATVSTVRAFECRRADRAGRIPGAY